MTLELDGAIRLGPDAKWVDHEEPGSPPEPLEADFHTHAASLLGEIGEGRLSWDGCGVRPKLFRDTGEVEEDFVVARHLDTSWHLLGVESPGLTSALALGALVAEEVAAAKP